MSEKISEEITRNVILKLMIPEGNSEKSHSIGKVLGSIARTLQARKSKAALSKITLW